MLLLDVLLTIPSSLIGINSLWRSLDWLMKEAHVNHVKFNKAKCKILHLGWGNSWYQQTGWWIDCVMNRLSAALQTRTWGYWWMKKWLWAINVCSQPAKRAVPWAVPQVCPGRGRGFCLYSLLWRDLTCSPTFSSGAPSSRKTWTLKWIMRRALRMVRGL